MNKRPPYIRDHIDAFLDRITRQHETGDHMLGITTGFKCLDERTLGLQPEEVTIIAGRPSHGKTGMMLSMATAQAQDGYSPLIVSVEMPAMSLLQRIISSVSGVDYREVQTGRNWKQNVGPVTKAVHEIKNMKVRVDDYSNSLDGFEGAAKELWREGQLDVVYVDYLQIVEPTNKNLARRLQIEEIATRLRRLARELKIPIVIMCQLNRESEHRKPPKPLLADLRESGALEQIADAVWLLYCPSVIAKQRGEVPTAQQMEGNPKLRENWLEIRNTLEINCAKLRNGPVGTERLFFYPEIQRISEKEIWGREDC